MGVLKILQSTIEKVGIKEVARRSGISPSTVSRINSGKINPSLEVVEKISDAVGLHLELLPYHQKAESPRLAFVIDILGRIRNELKSLGVKHAVIYGSVAREEDKAGSDIDIFLDFGIKKPHVAKLLKAEGRVIEAFGSNRVDVVSNLDSEKGQRLKQKIDMDGIHVF